MSYSSMCLSCGVVLTRARLFCRCNPPAPDGAVIPDGYLFTNTGACRSCGAGINWTMTRSGKRAPMNHDGTSHFATCPNAASHRAPRRER